ncbi:hypothetical protein RBB77_01585 [Tunturibacter psychrotolerans]|uniref:Uncharacterized protein n=1 Tax=Tunturiibacter psychrotolerans TaxID=3069686 RepID=A0AAU7ZRR6_9BACT
MANPVPNPVQRLRYFDGEYLRSYDFTDEQSYHIELRRLMNLKLHLHGIIEGLEITLDADSVSGGPSFYSITEGMAIDRTGREIIVPAPYSLTNVLTAPGLTAQDYEVWICYQETQTGLPAAGYLDCNVKNQNTRLQEGFQVYLKPVNGPGLVADCSGVQLGIITLTSSSLGWAVSNPRRWGRRYVGVRAQSVIAPDQIDAENDPFDITALTTPVTDHPLAGYLDIHPGAFDRGNVIVRKNLLVGDDFVLNSSDKSKVSYSANLPTFTPPITGDVKISNDLFLQGNFYGYNPASGQWYGLQQYIQGLTPVVQTGNASITITVPGAVPSPPVASGTVTVVVNSMLPAVTKPLQILVALTEIDWVDPKTLETDWLKPATVTSQFTVSVAGPSIPPPPAPSINLTISATVGPVVLDSSSVVQVPIKSVSVSYMVVFTP